MDIKKERKKGRKKKERKKESLPLPPLPQKKNKKIIKTVEKPYRPHTWTEKVLQRQGRRNKKEEPLTKTVTIFNLEKCPTAT